jgi:hypothetical protein
MRLDRYLSNEIKQHTNIHRIEEDAKKMGCRNWLENAQDRGCWQHLLEEAKAHPGL